MNSDAKHLGIMQTKPFFGCMIVDLDQQDIILKTEHFVKYYINSSIQKRLSLACLNIVSVLKTANVVVIILFQ